MNSPSIATQLTNTLVLALCALVAYSVWSLAAANRTLRAELADLRATTSVGSLGAGDRLPSVGLRALDGTTADLSELVAEGGVVAFLTTTCPFCEQTLPAWRALAERAANCGALFVALSLDDPETTRRYVEDLGAGLPLWALDVEETVPLPVERVPLPSCWMPAESLTGFGSVRSARPRPSGF